MDHTLYQVAQQPSRSGAQMAQLYQLATAPGNPRSLAARLGWGLLLVAGLLLASGLIFWIAANWQVQTRMFKLGLIEGALALSVLAACLWPRGRLPALLCATLALGGLLAFIGQTYQTGADAWQLFAVWAALSLVWVASARSDVLWTVWVLIAATGIVMWTGRIDLWNVLFGARQGMALMLWNMGLWLALLLVPTLVSCIPLLRLPQGMGWWSHRVALACALTAWVAMGVSSLVDSVFRESVSAVFLVCVLVAGALLLSLRGRWQDFISVCLSALAANVMVLSLVTRWAVESDEAEVVMLACSAAGLLCLGGTVMGLVAVQRRMRQQAAAVHKGQA